MPTISLTTFIDFVIASGTTRISCVRNAKKQYQSEYEPAFDFYRRLRNAIIQYHSSGESLDGALNDITDEKKQKSYRSCIRAYKRWVGRRQYEWVQPENSVVWECGQLKVRVNPELGLIISDQEYRIKLYFKADQLSKRKINTMLYLMQTTLSQKTQALRSGILDVQRGRLLESTVEIADIDALLVAETAAFVSMWDALRI